MDEEYNLSPGEVFIMQSEGVELICGRDSEELSEIVLTNKNLILVNEVPTGLFSSKRLLKRCPLDAIVCSEGIPQAFLGKKRDMYVLQVVFADEAVTLRFLKRSEKREAKRWAEAIKYAVVGDIDSINTDETPLGKDVTDPIDGLVGLAGAFMSEVTSASNSISKAKKPRKTAPVKATMKCKGCHAPLLGIKGRVVTCDYCGTKQTL